MIANLSDYNSQADFYFVTAMAWFLCWFVEIAFNMFPKVKSLFFNLGGVGGVHLLEVVACEGGLDFFAVSSSALVIHLW